MPLLVQDLSIPGPKLITPKRFQDARGFFCETYNAQEFAAAGVDAVFVQDNHSLSVERGVVRGLHFQTAPHAQAKLIRVLKGSIRDVVLDIRAGSPTYGRHLTVDLDDQNGQQLFVPTGFAHGFCTLVPNTEVAYKVTDFYAPDCDAGLLWNDPDLKIEWPDFAGASVSPKDAVLPRLAGFKSPFTFTA